MDPGFEETGQPSQSGDFVGHLDPPENSPELLLPAPLPITISPFTWTQTRLMTWRRAEAEEKGNSLHDKKGQLRPGGERSFQVQREAFKGMPTKALQAKALVRCTASH